MSEKMDKLQVGDVVCLKSGGPPMTVNSDGDGHQVECVWFAGDLQKCGFFKPVTLKKWGEK